MDIKPVNSPFKQTRTANAYQQSRSKRIGALLNEFEKEFPTEHACLKELFRLARIDDNSCRFCPHKGLEHQKDGRAGRCRSCNKLTWFTAGTKLHHLKKAKARLAAIYLADRGEFLSSSAFARVFKISQSSAFEILKWLSFAAETLMPDKEPLIHSSEFTQVFCKRSKETPAGLHPVSEQQRAEEEEEESRRASQHQTEREKSEADEPADASKDLSEILPAEALSASTTARAIIELLAKSDLYFDELCKSLECSAAELSSTLILLELDALVVRSAGDRYSRSKKNNKIQNSSQTQCTAIDQFMEFIRDIFHGISRKYLQRYLALYWCRSVTMLRSKGEFMENCLNRSTLLPGKNYATALLVQLPSTWNSSSEGLQTCA